MTPAANDNMPHLPYIYLEFLEWVRHTRYCDEREVRAYKHLNTADIEKAFLFYRLAYEAGNDRRISVH